jgi:hypothetical protein
VNARGLLLAIPRLTYPLLVPAQELVNHETTVTVEEYPKRPVFIYFFMGSSIIGVVVSTSFPFYLHNACPHTFLKWDQNESIQYYIG